LEKGRTVNINRDFTPRAYYYGIISWSSRFKDSLFTSLLRSVNAKRVSLIFGSVILAVFIFGAVKQKSSILIALMGAGFCQSIFQIILLYAFQVIYGYLFYKIGILFAFFMVGLGLAAWWFSRGGKYKQNAYSDLLYVQLGITVFSFALPLMVLWLTSVNSGFMSWVGANIFFPGLSLLSGLFGGSLFSYANHIYCIQTEGAGRRNSAALTYGLDCMGACLGAGLCGIFLIPIIGIVATCSLLAGLNLVVCGLLLFYLMGV
jgi:spermidine synthase